MIQTSTISPCYKLLVSIQAAVLLALLALPAVGQQPPRFELDEFQIERQLLKLQTAEAMKQFSRTYAFLVRAREEYGVALLLDRDLDIVLATTDRPNAARLYLAAEKEGYTARVASFGQALAGELAGIPNVIVISEQPLPEKLAAMLTEYEKSGTRIFFVGSKPPGLERAAALDISFDVDDEQFLRDLRAALGDRGHTLLVSREGAQSRLTMSQWDAGRDAKYVLVQGDWRWPPGRSRVRGPIRETMGYLRQVAGTDLIYDVTNESLQGKARPFVCELDDRGVRVYAILPVQIEEIAAAVKRGKEDLTLSVEFRDARGERLQAALPFQVRVTDAQGQTLLEHCVSTDRDGLYNQPLKLPDGAAGESLNLVVRSLLTGREQTLTFSR